MHGSYTTGHHEVSIETWSCEIPSVNVWAKLNGGEDEPNVATTDARLYSRHHRHHYTLHPILIIRSEKNLMGDRNKRRGQGGWRRSRWCFLVVVNSRTRAHRVTMWSNAKILRLAHRHSIFPCFDASSLELPRWGGLGTWKPGIFEMPPDVNWHFTQTARSGWFIYSTSVNQIYIRSRCNWHSNDTLISVVSRYSSVERRRTCKDTKVK